MSMRLGTFLVAFLLLVCAGFLLQQQFIPETQTLEDTYQGATVQVEIDRLTHVMVCPILTWDVSEAQHVHAENVTLDLPIKWSRKICDATPRITVFFNDGTSRDYRFTIEHLFLLQPFGLAALFAIFPLFLLFLWLMGWLATPRVLWRASGISLKKAGHDFRYWLQGEDRLHLSVLLVLLVIGVGFRLAYLNQGVRFDELLSLYDYASPTIPLTDGLSNYNRPNNHLLNTLLMHLSTLLFNRVDVWVLRLPVFLAGCALLPLSYLVGRRFYSAGAGLITLGFVAVSSPLILFSTNARGYLFVLLAMLLLLALAYTLKTSRNPFLWLLFMMFSVMGFYAMPMMVYPFGVVWVWLLLSILRENAGQRRWFLVRDLLITTSLAGWLTVLLYTPVFVRGGIGAVTDNQWVASIPLTEFIDHFPTVLPDVLALWFDGLPFLIVFILGVGFVLALVGHRQLANHRLSLAVIAVITLGGLLFVQRPFIFFARFLLHPLPLFLIIASGGLAYLLKYLPQQRSVIPLVACGLALLAGISGVQQRSVEISPETGTITGANAITLALEDELQAGDRLVTYRDFFMLVFRYYFEQVGIDTVYLERDYHAAERVFVVIQELPEESVENTLAQYLTPEQRAQFGEAQLVGHYGQEALYILMRE